MQQTENLKTCNLHKFDQVFFRQEFIEAGANGLLIWRDTVVTP
jgi:hypothetical protein